MSEMTIAKLAREAGVGVETIRYYQRRKLMAEPRRPAGSGFRHYGAGDLQRLRFIKSAQGAGFTLEEIGELIALDATSDRPRARDMARRRIAALDEKILELKAARKALHRLIDECSGRSSGPCPILSAFDR